MRERKGALANGAVGTEVVVLGPRDLERLESGNGGYRRGRLGLDWAALVNLFAMFSPFNRATEGKVIML